jgi:hypothetical protein
MLKGFFVAAPHDTGDPVMGHYYETASADPSRAQVWGYTDALSYAPGDRLALHLNSSAPEVGVEILQDGMKPCRVWTGKVRAGPVPTPADCSVRGCDWPERAVLTIPRDWPSGVYVAEFSVPGHLSRHMFVLRPATPAARVLMVLATGTWCAYNDWGGSNHYQGLTGPQGNDFAAEVSLSRPWATGFVRWPEDAPRIPFASPPLTRPRYPHMEYARANGVSKKYASSGWAAFERPFALWCEGQGIALDFATQHDLHRDPGLLNSHDLALIAGHDEYWTWEMRDHLESWLKAGGRLARFGGNFLWQTRLSPDLRTQTCYKSRAEAEDPVMRSDQSRLSTYWDAAPVGRPAAQTMGLTGAMGVYAGWSRCAARGAGGFTIYRPDHWALKGTGLGYGDVLGRDSRIFGYEVDGIDCVMREGLVFAAPETGLSDRLTVIGMAPATTRAWSAGPEDADPFIGEADVIELAEQVWGGRAEVERAARGNGMMADYRIGQGRVLNAGSCEWVAGLMARDPQVEQVTRNVLTGDWG